MYILVYIYIINYSYLEYIYIVYVLYFYDIIRFQPAVLFVFSLRQAWRLTNFNRSCNSTTRARKSCWRSRGLALPDSFRSSFSSFCLKGKVSFLGQDVSVIEIVSWSNLDAGELVGIFCGAWRYVFSWNWVRNTLLVQAGTPADDSHPYFE